MRNAIVATVALLAFAALLFGLASLAGTFAGDNAPAVRATPAPAATRSRPAAPRADAPPSGVVSTYTRAFDTAADRTLAVAGKDQLGRDAHRTVGWGGEGTTITVADLPQGSLLGETYRLQIGDRLTHVGPHEVGGVALPDREAALTMLNDAVARQMTLTVSRDGRRVELTP